MPMCDVAPSTPPPTRLNTSTHSHIYRNIAKLQFLVADGSTLTEDRVQHTPTSKCHVNDQSYSAPTATTSSMSYHKTLVLQEDKHASMHARRKHTMQAFRNRYKHTTPVVHDLLKNVFSLHIAHKCRTHFLAKQKAALMKTCHP